MVKKTDCSLIAVALSNSAFGLKDVGLKYRSSNPTNVKPFCY